MFLFKVTSPPIWWVFLWTKFMLKEFTWCVDAGATQDTEITTNTVKFGDGYEQVSSFGINNARKAWQCSKTGCKAEIDAIYDFLIEHKGVDPFVMDFEDNKETYRTSGSVSKSHQSGDVWQISFTVKQVFTP